MCYPSHKMRGFGQRPRIVAQIFDSGGCRGNEVRMCNRATLNHPTIARWDECVREMLSDSSVAFVTIVRTFYGFVVELTRRLLSALAP